MALSLECSRAKLIILVCTINAGVIGSGMVENVVIAQTSKSNSDLRSRLDLANRLDREIACILPTPAENKWQTIPWHLNLMEGRVQAQRTNKPILLWLMNGHPFGCT